MKHFVRYSLSLRKGIFLCAAMLFLLPMATHACRILDAPLPMTPMEAVAQASNKFGIALYQQVAAKGPSANQFMSPYSVFTALAMTSEGMHNGSLKTMEESLGLPEAAILHEGMQTLTKALVPSGSSYSLALANAIWPEKSMRLKAEFLRIIQDVYGGAAIPQDFKNEWEASRMAINVWVEEKTNHRIKDLIPTGVIDGLTRMVLTNAIYFKGKWETEFDKALTQKQSFILEDGEKVDVPTMYQPAAELAYAESNGMQALRLPYKGDALSMVILLPKRGELAPAEAKLDAELWHKILKSMYMRKVNVWLPRFKMEIGGSLKVPLMDMGMKALFSHADFSRMTGDSLDLAISDVIHKAFVEVNEKGTEAAAATAVIVRGTRSIREPQPPIDFRADHPFIFMIQHDASQSILFMGKVMKPN